MTTSESEEREGCIGPLALVPRPSLDVCVLPFPSHHFALSPPTAPTERSSEVFETPQATETSTMSVDDSSSNDWTLDDILFAKFAELDQKVALLREEMDSIASLLERRKRIRDSSISVPSQYSNGFDRLRNWIKRDAAENASLYRHRSNPPSIMLSIGASGRFYSIDPPTEHHDQRNATANAGLPPASFHPYRRPKSNQPPIATRTTHQPSSTLFASDFQEITDGVFLEQDDGAEDPPSDPDDNVGLASED